MHTQMTPNPQPNKRSKVRIALIAGGGLIALSVIGSALSKDKEADAQGAAATEDAAAVTPTTEAPATEAPANVESTTAAPVTETPVPETPAPVATEAPSSGMSASQENAVRSAQSYVDMMGFSRQGLIDQLSSEYGDQYSVADATLAVDSLGVDWNAEAAESAASYTDMMGFSCQGLIDQLSSEYGDKYTLDEARYGATQVGLC